MPKTFHLLLFLIIPQLLWSNEEKILKEARKYQIQIHITYSKKPQNQITSDDYSDAEIYYENKQTHLEMGTIFSQDRILLNLEIDAIDRIESVYGILHTGEKVNLKLLGIAKDFSSFVFSSEKALPSIKFSSLKKKSSTFEVFYNEQALEPGLSLLPFKTFSGTLSFFEKEKTIHDNNAYANDNQNSLIFDEKANVIGIKAYPYENTEGKLKLFNQKEIEIITLEELKAYQKKLLAEVHRSIFFVEVQYQKVKEEEYGYDNYHYSFWDNENTDTQLIGIALDDQGHLLVPDEIDTDRVKLIEKCIIKTVDGNKEAQFIGYFKNFNGFVLKCDGLITKANFQKEVNFKRNEIMLLGIFKWLNAENYIVEVKPARFIREEIGYKDQISQYLNYSASVQAHFLYNLNLEGIGMISSLKKDLDDVSEDDRYSYDSDNFILSIDRVLQEVSNANYDTEAMPQQRTEALKENWLGAETQTLTSDLIERFNASKETNFGEKGLLVNYIYPDSPAAKMPLKNLDILLSITAMDTNKEIDLKASSDSYYSFNYGNQTSINGIISKFKEGTSLKLKILRAGEIKEFLFTAEKSPESIITAEKYFCEDLGLHVKNLTYDMRPNYKKKIGDNGVLVVEVESGKPAQLAQIYQYSLIEKIDGIEVFHIDDLKKHIEEKLSEGAESFLFQIFSEGKNRIITVKINR